MRKQDMRVGHAATSLARIRSGRAAISAFITIMRHNCRPARPLSLSRRPGRPKSKDDRTIGPVAAAPIQACRIHYAGAFADFQRIAMIPTRAVYVLLLPRANPTIEAEIERGFRNA
jgi:hypothetical protein